MLSPSELSIGVIDSTATAASIMLSLLELSIGELEMLIALVGEL